MPEGVDYSDSRPGGAAIAAAGKRFVGRYIGPFGQKSLNPTELADLLTHGLDVFFIFEGTGRDATDEANGIADAQMANAACAQLGYPNAVVYFAVDEQTAPNPVAYFQGVNSVIGLARTGAYGGIGTLATLAAARVTTYQYQTYAWSGGQVGAGVHIYQHLNGQTVGGSSVDFDTNLKPYFGQINQINQAAASNPIPEEDDMGFYIQSSSAGSKYWFNQSTGKARVITSQEWSFLRAQELEAGTVNNGQKLQLVTVSALWLANVLAL